MTHLKMTRRAVLGAATIVGLTGGAAEAMHPKNDFNPYLKRYPGHHHRRRFPGNPDPTQPPTSTPTQGPTQSPTPDPTQSPSPNPIGTDGPYIGMAAAAWAQRLSEVGSGVTARRIYADLGAGATSKMNLVEDAHKAGMLPVISYKLGGDPTGAGSGKFNAVAQQAAAQLDSFGLPTAVTIWHEPYGDMTGAAYAALSRQLLPIFKRGKVRVGPLLNGWLLDNQQDQFASFCPDDLFQLWDWVGIDTYQSGTATNPGNEAPASRIAALRKFTTSRGYGDLPLGVGEYNGWTAQAISDTGAALLTTPNVWFGCVWNSTGGRGQVLSGDRLKAFQNTLDDPRSAKLIS